jgi:DNA (cytosine-5)-methyltransferase 1
MMPFSKIQNIDSFCGFGGEGLGIKQAVYMLKKIAESIAAINHDHVAMKCHKANIPEAMHMIEDFRRVFLRRLPRFAIDALRTFWASLECTNFSIAKGGLSRDPDSRTLAKDVLRYVDYQIYINQEYHYIYIENVKEFLEWGPLKHKQDKDGNFVYDKKGKPVLVPDPAKKGIYFRQWVKELRSRGYRMEYRILNAADFGVPTNRRRLFIIFAYGNMPIYWPEATHGKGLKKQKIVKNCLDLNNKGQNIFMRKKPLCENTLKRIHTGLEKHTVPTANRFALVQTEFLTKYYGNGENVVSVNEPAPTLTTKDRLTKIDVQFLDQQYGQSNPASLNKPAGAVTVNPKFNLVTAKFIATEYSQGTQSQPLNKPCGSLLTQPKQKLVTTERFLYNPQWGGQYSSVNKPSFTLIAKMDKMPPYLVTLETGELAIEVYETDSYWTRRIKEFMAEHGIVAIYMRMLTVEELLKIQGFPKNYKMYGSLTGRKKFIGNAVCPAVAKALFEALWAGLVERYEIRKAA